MSIFMCAKIIKEHIELIRLKKTAKKKGSVFERHSSADRTTILDGYNKIGAYTRLQNTVMGYGSYCGKYCKIFNTKIGKYCSIGANLTIIIGNHPLGKNVSTHPAFYSVRKQCGMTYVNDELYKETKWADSEQHYNVTIGNDVWIGTNVSILEGVKIGDGAVIGASAVIVKDVEPYSVCVGVPARQIKKRFSDNQIEILCRDKWWDKGEDWIKSHLDMFLDIEKYIESIDGEKNGY